MGIVKKLKRNNVNEAQEILRQSAHKIQEQFKAELAQRVINLLAKMGYEFDSAHDLHMFFKTRIKANIHQESGTTTMLLDGKEFCCYKEPVYTQKKDVVTIGFHFLEL